MLEGRTCRETVEYLSNRNDELQKQAIQRRAEVADVMRRMDDVCGRAKRLEEQQLAAQARFAKDATRLASLERRVLAAEDGGCAVEERLDKLEKDGAFLSDKQVECNKLRSQEFACLNGRLAKLEHHQPDTAAHLTQLDGVVEHLETSDGKAACTLADLLCRVQSLEKYLGCSVSTAAPDGGDVGACKPLTDAEVFECYEYYRSHEYYRRLLSPAEAVARAAERLGKKRMFVAVAIRRHMGI